MSIKRQKAAAPTATHRKILQQNESYRQNQPPSTEIHRAERIRKRRADIPPIHRKIYDRAMQGKSMKSAIKSFCLECCGWQKEEVRFCTSLACPLYPYRPYRISNRSDNRTGFDTESKNTGKEGSH